ncbi:MAG TPA: VOC family protein [Candidatus Saccharimonadales bacterium]|nr:VOC family protein [Candidatus Saccharimonadales bacterium]
MDQRLSLVTLGVEDLDRAVAFYRDVLGWTPAARPPGVAFFDLDGVVLSLWPHADLAAELGLAPDVAPYRGMTLAHNLRSRAEVDALFDTLRERGAEITRSPTETEWGGYSGYFSDPDGHRWEVAHNPGWPLAEDGRVLLPHG